MTSRELESRLRHRTARHPLLRGVRDSCRLTGGDVWVVGGFVRDAALGRHSDEVDLVGGRGTARLVAHLQKLWGTRGHRFRKRNVTTWRFVVGDDRLDLVDASRRGLEADLRRRELTLNAIAFDPLESRIVDPLRGLADLRAGRLRTPRPGVMREDPLRALRAARFLAQLPDFRLLPDARRQARAVGKALRRVAVERVAEELDKLLRAEAPRRGLEALVRLDLLTAVLPELEPLRHCVAGQQRPDVWRHTLDAIGCSATPRGLPAAAVVRDPAARGLLRWALLLHDISKPETLEFRPGGRPAFHGHEVLGSRRADALLRRLRFPAARRKRICRLVELHLRPSHLADAGATPRGLRRLARDAGEDLAVLVLHAACDARASGGPDAPQRWRRLGRVLRALLETGESRRRSPLPRLLDGRDVMRLLALEEGPAVGRILDRLRDAQEEGTVGSRREALEWLQLQIRGRD